MSSLKNKIIDEIIRVEGGYVNDPDDSGGETKFGITKEVARAFGYSGPMIDLPREIAFKIYEGRYWTPIRGNDLESLSVAVATEVVDTGVNAGIHRASVFLQRSLNVLNNRAKLYPDIAVDGLIGDGTLTALSRYLEYRDEDTLVNMLNCLQGAFYVELAERREKDERFIYGWFKNRVV